MDRTKRRFLYIMTAGMLLFSGCAVVQNDKEQQTTETESIQDGKGQQSTEAEEAVLLTSAPEIILSDSLSSTFNEFKVQSGNYIWNYSVGNEMAGEEACGFHPLDTQLEKADKLKLSAYQNMEEVSYLFSCVVQPDRVTVREWDIAKLGDTEAEADAEIVYEDAVLLKLKPDKVYQLVAVWDETNLETNGFYGEASYAFITESYGSDEPPSE